MAMPMDQVGKAVDDIDAVLCDMIGVFKGFKGGGILGVFKLASELLPVLSAVKDLVSAGPLALPQLAHMDADAAAFVGQKAYQLFADVVAAIQK